MRQEPSGVGNGSSTVTQTTRDFQSGRTV